jgi:serine protease Do
MKTFVLLMVVLSLVTFNSYEEVSQKTQACLKTQEDFCDEEGNVFEEDICVDKGDKGNKGNKNLVIVDKKLSQEFSQKVNKLIEAKKTVDMKELVAQAEQTLDKVLKIKLPEPSVAKLSTEDLYAKYLKSTLMVAKPYLCTKCKNLHMGFASGFIISDTGLCVTSYHVMSLKKKAKYQTMAVMNGEGKLWAVEKVLSGNKVNDFVILQLKGNKGEFSPVPIKTNITTGERIRTLTNPVGHFFTLSEGIVTRQYKSKNTGLWFNIDADYCKGSSGGAIFDKFGNVLGIVATTNSIYYTTEKGVQKNLQMVFKNVTSSANITKCFE